MNFKNSIKWSGIDKLSEQAIRFIINIALARILEPSDFGLIASLAIIISLSEAFINSGFGQAIIQKKYVTKDELDSVFYFNLVISIFISFLIILFSETIAIYLDSIIIKNLSIYLSFGLIINSAGLIQRSLLAKELNFKSLFYINISSIFISGILSVLFALNNYGVWSLVILNITYDIVNTSLAWMISKWRPRLFFKLKSLRKLFKFGSNLLLVSLLNSISDNLSKFFIGKFYNPQNLGYFNRANNLSKYQSTLFTSIINQVTFPFYSKLNSRNFNLKKITSNTTQLASFIIFPLLIFFIFNSAEIITLLLTNKWLETDKYILKFGVIAILQPFQSINFNVINAFGESNKFLKLITVNKILNVITFFLVIDYGLNIILLFQLIFNIQLFISSSIGQSKITNYKFTNQLYDIAPFIMISILYNYLIRNIDLFQGFLILELIIRFIILLITYTLTFKFLNKIPNLNLKLD